MNCKTCFESKSERSTNRSVQTYINALDTGQKWSLLSLKYYFYKTADPVPADNYTRRDWSDTQKTNFRAAISKWSSISALSLQETLVLGEADVKLILLDDSGYPYLGHAYFPGDANKGQNYISYNNAADKNFTVGSYDYITMVHELGHTLGLAHPHDTGGSSSTFPGVSNWSNLGVNQQNQTVYTVMSYNDLNGPITPNTVQSYGFIEGPMAYDIEVMVRKYGNVAKNTGNNTYQLPTSNTTGTYFTAIKDTHGLDTISAAGSDKPVRIDLRAATLNANGGKPSKANGVYGGFTIAKGTRIEGAIGGNNNDVIIGNNRRNVLQGRGGNDIIYTGGGNNTVYAGSGNDKIIVRGANNRIFAQSGRNVINARRARNTVVIGGTGHDTFLPGPGRNIFIGGGSVNRVIISANRRHFRVIRRRRGVYHIRPKLGRLRRKFGSVTVLRNVRILKFRDTRLALR